MAGRLRLSARQQAVAAMQSRHAEAMAQRAERLDAQQHLAAVAGRETARGEEVSVPASTGPLTVLSRDGLVWAMRKGVLTVLAYEAGLQFRTAYELANGTGVASCLASAGMPGGGGGVSVTAAMIAARGHVEAALGALGTPLLHPYVRWVAGEGVMLSDARFVKDPKRVAEVVLPCRIAFDLLARHYGMIR